MRFDKRIHFVTESPGGYNPEKGEYDEKTETTITKPCNLSTLGVTRTNELFGQIDRKITVARLQHPYTDKFDFIRLGNSPQKYDIKRQSDYRKGVFYLESDVSG